MTIDPSRLVVFLHILLFAYWLGADLGVLITSVYAGKPGTSADARANLLKANIMIDMAPRTCLVLMVPVALTLGSYWGLPLSNAMLTLAWVFGFAWTWLVWQVHFEHGSDLGKLYWKIDLGIRILATIGFVGYGVWCLAGLGDLPAGWIALKMVLFGLTTLCGVIVRFLLLAWSRPAAIAKWDASKPVPFFNPIRNVVFIIWILVAAMAFLGVTKPF